MRTVTTAPQTVNGLIATHTMTLRHLEQGDPLDALSREELAAANTLIPHVAEMRAQGRRPRGEQVESHHLGRP